MLVFMNMDIIRKQIYTYCALFVILHDVSSLSVLLELIKPVTNRPITLYVTIVPGETNPTWTCFFVFRS